MLDLLSSPVSVLLWLWHHATSLALGPASGAGWVTAIVLLVITLRALLLRPALAQARSARTLRALRPDIDRLRRRHGADRRRCATELQKLHAEHGVSPAAGCLPMLVQLPVLLGLSHLVYSLGRTPAGEGRWVFDAADVHSFETARFAGGQLTSALHDLPPSGVVVSVLLIVIAAVGGHVNARRVLRDADPATPGARWIQRFSLWGAPAGAVIAGPFLATAILVYWATTTVCSYAQSIMVERLTLRLAPA